MYNWQLERCSTLLTRLKSDRRNFPPARREYILTVSIIFSTSRLRSWLFIFNQVKMTTPYKHGPLDLKVPSIRLLYLQPGEADEPIACKLSVSRLDERPYFSALSYTWGDANTRKPILIDGHILDVTANLHDALKILRPSLGSHVEPMWIDAICINQQDIAERNHQVRQVGKLYMVAGRVITWLG